MNLQRATGVLITVVAALFVGQAAFAQATRTWVSGVGDDVNPCSRTAPCKTFAGAISKTSKGGEINAIDPGGFGAVTITKAITIDGMGTMASIIASGTTGVIVNVTPGSASDGAVRLKNLSINGVGAVNPPTPPTPGIRGVNYIAGQSLSVENCVIEGFSTRGIDMNLTNNGRLDVVNTSIQNTSIGVRVATSVGLAQAALRNVRLLSNATGLNAVGNAIVTISDSLVAHNTSFGIIAEGNGQISAENNVVSNNGIGVQSTSTTSIVTISNNNIFRNGTGLVVGAGAQLLSFLNNKNHSNTTNGAPSGPVPGGEQ
jgi:hypothetical protein